MAVRVRCVPFFFARKIIIVVDHMSSKKPKKPKAPAKRAQAKRKAISDDGDIEDLGEGGL